MEAQTLDRKRYNGQSDKNLHQRRFLEAFAVCCSVQKAARWAGVHRQCHYDWLRLDPNYPARFAEAQARAAQSLEDEAVRRAHEGIRRPRLHNGKPVFVNGEMQFEIEFSDRLLVELLRANNPKKFNPPKETIDLTRLDVNLLTEPQIDMLIEAFVEKWFEHDPEKAAAALAEMGMEVPQHLKRAARVVEAKAEVVRDTVTQG